MENLNFEHFVVFLMSEEKKEEKKTETPKETPSKSSQKEISLTASEKAELAKEQAKIAAARSEAARTAAEAAAEEEYKAAAAEAKSTTAVNPFTNKRGKEQIFRRELGEPEFWLDKKDRGPPRYIMSAAEEKEISKRVEIPTNQIPDYNPERMLSPEFMGTSNYESGITDILEETKQKLDRLKNDPDSNPDEIIRCQEDLKTLESLYENYYVGMSVFRTAKGGRDKVRT